MPTPEPKSNFDVVVVNYNSTEVLLNLLDDFDKLSFRPDSFSVIDNGSSDNPKRIVDRFPWVDLVLTGRNLGFGRGANLGWQRGSSPYVLFINPDSRLCDTNFQKMTDFLDDNPQIGILGSKILNDDGTVQGSARGFHRFATIFAGRKGPLTKYCPTSAVVKRDVPLLASDGKSPLKVDWVSGACMMVRREALVFSGGFDERYFMYFEDADLCMTIARRGLSTMYFPKIEIFHSVGHSSGKKPFNSIFWFHQSWYRYMCKNHFPRNVVAQSLAAMAVGIRFGMMLFIKSLPGRTA